MLSSCSVGAAFGRRSVAAVILVVTLGASACGGGSSKGVAVTATTTSSSTPGTRNQAFLQCMQAHGVNVTSLRGLRGGTTPSSLPAGVTAAQFQQAFQACRSQLPTGGGQGFQNNPAFAAYRNCLTLHGVTLPQRGQGPGTTGTSTTAGAAGGGPGLGGLDRTNPTVQAALQACAALRPSGGPGGSTTTPTT